MAAVCDPGIASSWPIPNVKMPIGVMAYGSTEHLKDLLPLPCPRNNPPHLLGHIPKGLAPKVSLGNWDKACLR